MFIQNQYFDRLGTGRKYLQLYKREVTYAALFLPNKELLEKQREKQVRKVPYHLNMMFDSSLGF